MTNPSIAARLLEAAHFAALSHQHQRRKGELAEPYINHLLEVAELLTAVLGDSDVELVMAALLHDTIEDTPVTPQQLAQRFGADVATLVVEVTDDRTLSKAERKRRQVETAPALSRRAQWLKIADKISNLRSLRDSPPVGWDSIRRREYIRWSKSVVDALPDPHPVLKEQFEQLYTELAARFGIPG